MIARNIGQADRNAAVAELDGGRADSAPGVKAKPAALRAKPDAGLSWRIKLAVAVLLGALSWVLVGLLVAALMR